MQGIAGTHEGCHNDHGITVVGHCGALHGIARRCGALQGIVSIAAPGPAAIVAILVVARTAKQCEHCGHYGHCGAMGALQALQAVRAPTRGAPTIWHIGVGQCGAMRGSAGQCGAMWSSAGQCGDAGCGIREAPRLVASSPRRLVASSCTNGWCRLGTGCGAGLTYSSLFSAYNPAGSSRMTRPRRSSIRSWTRNSFRILVTVSR